MPKIRYRDYNPRGATGEVVAQADEILHEYYGDGYTLSIRQLYYVFISRDLFPESWIDEAYNERQGLDPQTKNTMKNYSRLKGLCTNAREGGFLDWDHIVDRGRKLEQESHWRNPEAFLESVCSQFKIDLWLDQPRRVEVWVEKDALSEVIERACKPLDVPYFACKGYASASSVWEAGYRRFLNKYGQAGQMITVLHLSDHDPSGLDMTRDLERRLKLFSRVGNDVPDIRIRRIALTMDQVREYNPPPNPAKETDPRSANYRARWGDNSWELDALMSVGPSTLVDLITEAICEEMEDPEGFSARSELQLAARDQMEQISDEYSNVMDHLGMEHLDCGGEPD